MMSGWMSGKVLNSNSENYRSLMVSRDPVLLLTGGARMGKTTDALRKLFGLHFKNYGFQSGIVRTNSVDLHDTIREDIKFLSRYELEDPRCPLKIEGGKAFHTIHINGGRCTLGGMNRPGRILGTDKDAILFSQAEQSNFEQYQILRTRVGGTAGNWVENGKVMHQFLMDENPDRRDHYLIRLVKAQQIRQIQYQFTDNPLFFRKGRWTQLGIDFVEDLDESLEGVYHDRYFKGIASDPEGAVFELTDAHFVDELPDDIESYLFYNCMDFGMAEPNVCLWVGRNTLTKDLLVIRDFRRTKTDIIAFGNQVRDFKHRENYRILNTVIDNDENNRDLLRKHCGISAVMAQKGPGSRIYGINLIQQALERTLRGEKGGLRFYRGLRDGIRPDPNLLRNHKPMDLITEMQNLQYRAEHEKTGTNADDLPVGRDKHGIDALMYLLVFLESQPIGTSFASGGVARRTRV